MTSKGTFTTLAAVALICIILTAPIPFRRLVNPTVYPPPDGSATRVLLLGDSVARQYFDALASELPAGTRLVTLRAPVTQTLVGRLHTPVDEMVNTRDSSHLLDAVRAWMPRETFDTILINAGLHDLRRDPHGHDAGLASLEGSYRRNLSDIVRLLRPHAGQVCFVATTPIVSSPPELLERENVDLLNRVAKEVMTSLDGHFIEIHWPPDAPSMFQEDGYHLNGRGSAHIARAIADYLKRFGRSRIGPAQHGLPIEGFDGSARSQ